MKIYKALTEARVRNLVFRSREYEFHLAHQDLLNIYPDFTLLRNTQDDFLLIQANVIIQALINYQNVNELIKIDEKITDHEDKIVTFDFNGATIYVPFFSVATNLLLKQQSLQEVDLELFLIDFFETYNFSLYESKFTGLVYVMGDKTTRAYYHYDFNTIYIINNQGRLDVKISLFDRFMTNPDYRNIIDRTKPALAAYYSGSRRNFIKALHDGKLISTTIFDRYMRFLNRRKII